MRKIRLAYETLLLKSAYSSVHLQRYVILIKNNSLFFNVRIVFAYFGKMCCGTQHVTKEHDLH